MPLTVSFKSRGQFGGGRLYGLTSDQTFILVLRNVSKPFTNDRQQEFHSACLHLCSFDHGWQDDVAVVVSPGHGSHIIRNEGSGLYAEGERQVSPKRLVNSYMS